MGFLIRRKGNVKSGLPPRATRSKVCNYKDADADADDDDDDDDDDDPLLVSF